MKVNDVIEKVEKDLTTEELVDLIANHNRQVDLIFAEKKTDEDGYLTYVGRTDDVFKASDYKISPFELESVLIEHPAVVEAAIVPAPDPIRLAVPKAYVALAAGVEPSAETALSILRHAKDRLAPYLRVRRVEFAELPKTISGKVRRVVLRAREHDASVEIVDFRYEQFPELRG